MEQVDADVAAPVEIGLQITQQTRNLLGVPDGCIYQSPFRIVIETKLNASSFSPDQLRRHLAAFGKGESGWLMLLSPETPQLYGAGWQKLTKEASRQSITIIAITFGQIISAIRKNALSHNEEIQTLIDDYEEFCISQNLVQGEV